MGAVAGRFAATLHVTWVEEGEAVGRVCTKSLQNFGIVVQADACFATAPDVKNSETRAAVHSLIGKSLAGVYWDPVSYCRAFFGPLRVTSDV